MKNFVEVLKTQYMDFYGKTNLTDFTRYFLIWLGVVGFFPALEMIFPVFFMPAIRIIGGLISIALIMPTIAIAIRRLNDAQISPWYLLAALIPAVGPLFVVFLLCAESKNKK